MHLAAANRRLQTARCFLHNLPSPISAQDSTGETALHDAIKAGHASLAQGSLKYAPEIAAICDRKEESPLQRAVRRHSSPLAHYIISRHPSLVGLRGEV